MKVQDRANKLRNMSVFLIVVGLILFCAGGFLYVFANKSAAANVPSRDSGHAAAKQGKDSKPANASTQNEDLESIPSGNSMTDSETEMATTSDPNVDTESQTEAEQQTTKESSATVYRVRIKWNDPSSQIGAWHSLVDAIASCPIGYYVFDEDGNIVYDPGNGGQDSEPVMVRVPSVQGMTASSAIATIKANLLRYEITEKFSSTVSNGNIISQYPEAYTEVEANTVIYLTVSKGSETVKMISVVGQSEEAALQALWKLSLSAGVVYVYSSSVPAGIVISQNYNPGMEIPAGTTVTLLVSLGPEPSPTQPTEPPTVPTEPPTEPPTVPDFAIPTESADSDIVEPVIP